MPVIWFYIEYDCMLIMGRLLAAPIHGPARQHERRDSRRRVHAGRRETEKAQNFIIIQVRHEYTVQYFQLIKIKAN